MTSIVDESSRQWRSIDFFSFYCAFNVSCCVYYVALIVEQYFVVIPSPTHVFLFISHVGCASNQVTARPLHSKNSLFGDLVGPVLT